MKVKKWILGTGIFIVPLMSIWLTGCSGQTEVIPELLTPVQVADDTAVVFRGNVAVTEQYAAAVMPFETELAFGDVSLRVSGILAREGDAVQAGDVIIMLDTEHIEKEIQRIEEQIEQTEYDNAHYNALAEIDIEIAIANIKVTEREYAQKIAEQEEALRAAEQEYASGLAELEYRSEIGDEWYEITEQEFALEIEDEWYETTEQEFALEIEGLLTALETARQAYASEIAELKFASENDLALKRIALEKSRLLLSQNITQQDRDLHALDMEITKLKTQRENATLTAPQDGVITQILIELNHYVQPFTTVAVLADKEKSFIMGIENDYISYHPAFTFTARIGTEEVPVEYIQMPIEEQITYILQGNTPPLRFSFANDKAPDWARLGQFAPVTVTRNSAHDVLLIPVNSIYSTSEGKYVYVYRNTAGGHVIKEPAFIKTGVSNESYVEVIEGLEEGDVVFVKP